MEISTQYFLDSLHRPIQNNNLIKKGCQQTVRAWLSSILVVTHFEVSAYQIIAGKDRLSYNDNAFIPKFLS